MPSQAVEKARYAIFSAETGFTCACGAAGESCKETLLRKASEPTAHVAGFGLQSEATEVSVAPVGPWAKPKANRRSQPKRAEGTASALCDD